MNVSLEKNGAVDGKIIVSVDVADYADKVKKQLRKISETHVIPGFRKGHVPMDQLRRRFGRDVKSDVINDIVYDAVTKYIQDEKLPLLGQPIPVDVEEINMDEKPYTFTFEVGFAPELNVEVDKEITLPYYTIEITDEMREDQDTMLRRRLGSQVPGEEVEPDALVKGAIFELNEDGTVKETEDAIQVVSGIVGPAYFKDKAEAEKFAGKKVNDKVRFNPYASCEGNVAELASMLNIDRERAANVKADFEFVISEIIVLRPAELGQEYYDQVFGKDQVHNEEEYRAALDRMIARDLEPNSNQLFAAMTHKYFVEKYKDMELPVEFLKKWLLRTDKDFTAENIDAEFDKVRDQIVWELVSGNIAEKLHVSVNDEFMLEQAKGIAYQQFAQYGITNMDEETITEHAKRILATREYYRRIYENAQTNMLYGAIRNAVTIDDQTVTFDQFKKLAAEA